MTYLVTLSFLLVAALCEAGGDAPVRTGLHASDLTNKIVRIVGGGLVLLLYGLVVNAPAWDFGRLLGVYVVFFFVIAQLISFVAFHEAPTPAVWVGGGLIVAGGIVISLR